MKTTGKRAGELYALPERCYAASLDMFPPVSEVPNMVVVSNMDRLSRSGSLEWNRAYVEGFKSLMTSIGYNVTLRQRRPCACDYRACSIDEDVVFMAHAQFFVRGGGGFSNAVSTVANELGGRAIIPRCPQEKGPKAK